MKTVIVCSGTIKDDEFFKNIINSADYIICADGGSEHLYRIHSVPDVIIGDMDSSDSECIDFFIKSGVKVIKFPSDKDKTDTQICIEYAMVFSKEIALLGATGSRIDHMLANISLLKMGLDNNVIISIIDNNNEIYITDSRLILTGNYGDIISLIPFSEKVEGVSIDGVFYKLDNALMEIGNPYGVSNYFIGDKVSISVNKGYLLVIKSRD